MRLQKKFTTQELLNVYVFLFFTLTRDNYKVKKKQANIVHPIKEHLTLFLINSHLRKILEKFSCCKLKLNCIQKHDNYITPYV